MILFSILLILFLLGLGIWFLSLLSQSQGPSVSGPSQGHIASICQFMADLVAWRDSDDKNINPVLPVDPDHILVHAPVRENVKDCGCSSSKKVN